MTAAEPHEGAAAFSDGPDGALVRVRVSPRSSRDSLGAVETSPLSVKLTAPAVDGEANRALVDFLAERLDLPRRAVEIVRGHRSRRKTLVLRGLSAREAVRRLSALRPDS
jgi:hypothetical protein